MKDSMPNQKTITENEASAEPALPEDPGTDSSLRLSGKNDTQLPTSIVGGLIGMLAGTLPAAIWVLIFRVPFSPLYVFLPLLVYGGIRVFRGYREKRGFIVTCIFSVLGFYLTLLSCQAALDVLKYKMLFINLPLVTITRIGKSGALSGPVFSSAYVFPALFAILGGALAYLLLMKKSTPASVPEPEADTEAE